MSPSFDPQRDIPALDGKVILVTGGNSGIGAATVRALAAHHPACMYLCARNVASGEAVVSQIRKQTPYANITVLPLDLASFESVRMAAAAFNEMSDRLDILFLNAGVAGVAPGLTKEGHEVHFGVNYVGHALLTQLLLPKMLETKERFPKADLRIHMTASLAGVMFAPKTGLDLNHVREPEPLSNGVVRYGHSKLACLLFAQKLAQLYPQITTMSSHPGTVRSESWGKMDGAKLLAVVMGPIVRFTGVTSDEGAKNQLWCTTAPVGRLEVESGNFYVPVGKKYKKGKFLSDAQLRDVLWRWTMKELEKHGAPGWPTT